MPARRQDGAMAELAEVVDEALLGLGDGITRDRPERDRVNP
ncbi:hypothetical protein OHA88_12945 [Streptomyces sp. NBC_00353]